jgi:hypothetical protein
MAFRLGSTNLLGDEITRIRITTLPSLVLFEYDPEQARMSGFVATSQLGRGFLVRGIGAGILTRRRGGGIRIEGDGHREGRLRGRAQVNAGGGGVYREKNS